MVCLLSRHHAVQESDLNCTRACGCRPLIIKCCCCQQVRRCQWRSSGACRSVLEGYQDMRSILLSIAVVNSAAWLRGVQLMLCADVLVSCCSFTPQPPTS
jgi:hypothetical protein